MTHWAKIAADGEELIRRMPATGSVKLKRAEAAEALGVSAMTLHNYQSARLFSESLKTTFPELASGLLRLPATAVGVYSRWWKRDPPAAQQHLRKALEEGWSAARITSDERAAREKAAPLSILERALASSAEVWQRLKTSEIVHNGLGSDSGDFRLANLKIERNPVDLSRALGAAEVLMSLFDAKLVERHEPDAAKHSIAVLPVERGVTGDAHRKYAKWTLARATVCASVHRLAVVLLADTRSVTEFMSALYEFDAFLIAKRKGACLFELTPGSLVLVAPADRFAEIWSGVRP